MPSSRSMAASSVTGVCGVAGHNTKQMPTQVTSPVLTVPTPATQMFTLATSLLRFQMQSCADNFSSLATSWR